MTTAIDPSHVGTIFGTKTIFENLAAGGFALQQRLAVIAHSNTGQGNSLTKLQISSSQQAADVYGFGSQIHVIATQAFPANGDGVGSSIPVTIYPLADGTTAALGEIAPDAPPTSVGTFFIVIGNVSTAAIPVPASTTVAAICTLFAAAIQAVPLMPVTAVATATEVDLTAKWKGLTGNAPTVQVNGTAGTGTVYGITTMAGGAGDPEIDSTLLAQFGEVFETMVINGLGGTTPALDALSAFGEGRWAPELARPVAGAFYASVETDVNTAITVPDARGTDRTNSQLMAPGSNDLPWKIAGRMVTRIIKVANSRSPASDYVGQLIDGIDVGADNVQWDSGERNTAVTSGTSTSRSLDSVVQLVDTVTFFHPTGDPTPAYRYCNDIVKIQQMLNDMRIVFDTPKWQAAPLIPDDQATEDINAKKPKMAKAELAKLARSWGSRALISDVPFALASIIVAFDGSNARRLNMSITVKLSSNGNIISQDLKFGFNLPAAAAA